MKIVNPVYRQETRAGSRSFRLPLIILVFNGVLAVVALLDMYTIINRVKLTAELQYSGFLGLYVFVATVEFVLLLILIPGITAGSISGERERRTLDLMQTTLLTPADLVFGKLASCLSTVFLLIVSSFPILGLVFIYGGVTMADIGFLLLSYMVTALLVGSIGIFCSAVSRRTTMATVSAYCLVVLLTVGTVTVNFIASGLAEMTPGAGVLEPGRTAFLLLGNPAALFQAAIDSQMGDGAGLSALLSSFSPAAGGSGGGLIAEHWWISCAAVQLGMAALFPWGAVKAMSPRRRRN